MKRIYNITRLILPHVILIIAVFISFGIIFDLHVAVAQMPGGGFNISIFTYCTCGPGYMALITGVGSTPSGIYYFGPQTQYWVGSGFPVASWLGFYTPQAGICMMESGPSCFDIQGNLMNWYGGSS